jgi:hypothetical protein
MTFKPVLRLDRQGRTLRLFRFAWNGREITRGGWPVSHKLSLALRPALYNWQRESDGWLLTLLGLRIHHARSHGGRFV